MAEKLNSMRILEQHKIPYEVLAYPDTVHDAQEVAEILGVPDFMVYKTLVVQSENPTQPKPYLVMIASENKLDLKKMALAAGVKKVRMAAHKDAEAMTGLKVGGISALALMQKGWQVYLDQPASQLQHIVMSAGQRGTQLRVPVVPLVNLLRVRLAEISIPNEDDESGDE
ncbi:MAG: YbaK/EbsC family protein [Phototrophicales bacterium]|nr:YbaK/EbsC family protein [Phototrophicales bacterium]